jgi:hypothetical protein
VIEAFYLSCCLPILDSKTILPGGNFSHTFNSIGNFTYFDTGDPNISEGMVTVVQNVTEFNIAYNATQIRSSNTDNNATLSMNGSKSLFS